MIPILSSYFACCERKSKLLYSESWIKEATKNAFMSWTSDNFRCVLQFASKQEGILFLRLNSFGTVEGNISDLCCDHCEFVLPPNFFASGLLQINSIIFQQPKNLCIASDFYSPGSGAETWKCVESGLLLPHSRTSLSRLFRQPAAMKRLLEGRNSRLRCTV